MRARIERVRGHASFRELRRTRDRGYTAPIKVFYVASPEVGERVEVAYAVSRAVGGAVERNRWRRRLRSIVRETVGTLPAGRYLVRVDPGAPDLPYAVLRERFAAAARMATSKRGKGSWHGSSWCS